MLDLEKLEKDLDTSLDKETEESLTEWLKYRREGGLTFPDIRNKLSPITTLISLIEDDRDTEEMIKELLPEVKKSINYLINKKIN